MCQHVISMVISDVCESGANYKLWTHPAFQFISSDRGNCATCLIYSINPHGLCFRRIMTIQFSTIELWLIKDFCVLQLVRCVIYYIDLRIIPHPHICTTLVCRFSHLYRFPLSLIFSDHLLQSRSRNFSSNHVGNRRKDQNRALIIINHKS